MEEQVNDPQNPKITILGKEHMFKDLPEDVQKMVTLYNAWNVDLAKQQTEVMKLELAIRGVTQDIMRAMSETTGEAVKLEVVDPKKNAVVDAVEIEGKLHTGTVKWFNDAKGMGYIEPDDKTEGDLFVHFSQLMSGTPFKTLEAGERVSFYIRSDSKGKQAVTVTKLKS